VSIVATPRTHSALLAAALSEPDGDHPRKAVKTGVTQLGQRLPFEQLHRAGVAEVRDGPVPAHHTGQLAQRVLPAGTDVPGHAGQGGRELVELFVDQGERGLAVRGLTQRDRQQRVERRPCPPLRSDETPAAHDALVRDQLGQLAVEAAGRGAGGVGLPDPDVAAGPFVHLGPGDRVASRGQPPGQQLRVEPRPVDLPG
jgi:hypothetical protein